jgi:hypothetical protein
MSGDAAAGGDASSLVEGRSASANGGVHQEYTLPKDAVAVTRPDGTTIDDPKSPTKKLMAPPRANFQEVFAAGKNIANWPISDQLVKAKAALEQFGTYDFQRDRATNTWFSKYVHAANYAVGVYMAGAGYGELASVKIAQTWGFFTSSTRYSSEAKNGPKEVGNMPIETIGKPNEEAFHVGHCRRRCNHPAYCGADDPSVYCFIHNSLELR